MPDGRPDFIRNVRDLPDNGGSVWSFAGSDEVLGVRTRLGRPLGLTRLGVNHDVLAPGQRSSLPHAERYEEECVYVLEGRPAAWIDGTHHRLGPDDFVAYTPRGVEHTILNDTESPVRLMVIGERLDAGHAAAGRMAALWSSGDEGELEATFREEFEYRDPAFAVACRGRAGIARLVAERRAALPALRMELGDVLVSGDRVAARWTLEGAHGGPVEGVSMLELVGSRIARQTDFGRRDAAV